MYGWISTIIMMLAKPRTKLIRTNRNAYCVLIMLMLSKVSEPLLNRIHYINLDKNTCKLPCGLGIRIQRTFALVRVVRVD